MVKYIYAQCRVSIFLKIFFLCVYLLLSGVAIQLLVSVSQFLEKAGGQNQVYKEPGSVYSFFSFSPFSCELV